MPIPDYIARLRKFIGNDLIMIPSVVAVIFNDHGEVLLQRRTDNGEWSLLGGVVEPNEEPAEAIIREIMEEAGVAILPERISGVYGGATYNITYPNGDCVQMISTAFVCRITDGEPHINDDESLEIRFFAVDRLPDMPHRHVERIEHALQDRSEAFFHQPKA